MKLYFDGLEVNSAAQSGNIVSSAGINLGIGLKVVTNTLFFNGTIDDVRIYDRALSAGEIWELYQKGVE